MYDTNELLSHLSCYASAKIFLLQVRTLALVSPVREGPRSPLVPRSKRLIVKLGPGRRKTLRVLALGGLPAASPGPIVHPCCVLPSSLTRVFGAAGLRAGTSRKESGEEKERTYRDRLPISATDSAERVAAALETKRSHERPAQ